MNTLYTANCKTCTHGYEDQIDRKTMMDYENYCNVNNVVVSLDIIENVIHCPHYAFIMPESIIFDETMIEHDIYVKMKPISETIVIMRRKHENVEERIFCCPNGHNIKTMINKEWYDNRTIYLRCPECNDISLYQLMCINDN